MGGRAGFVSLAVGRMGLDVMFPFYEPLQVGLAGVID
jgi:hypothetical protein